MYPFNSLMCTWVVVFLVATVALPLSKSYHKFTVAWVVFLSYGKSNSIGGHSGRLDCRLPRRCSQKTNSWASPRCLRTTILWCITSAWLIPSIWRLSYALKKTEPKIKQGELKVVCLSCAHPFKHYYFAGILSHKPSYGAKTFVDLTLFNF